MTRVMRLQQPECPQVLGVYETVLYAPDIQAATAFYRDVLGLALVAGPTEIIAGFRLASGAMLLIFDPRQSSVQGRAAPSHGAEGAGHVAFQVDKSEIEAWRNHLHQRDIEIEKDVSTTSGSQQLYVRDPAANSVELVAGDLWPYASQSNE